MWSELPKAEFKSQLSALSGEYRQDNSWVGKWTNGASWDTPAKMDEYIESAYALYRATLRSNTLELVVLGGTEIRTDPYYLFQFGLTAANGLQSPDDWKIVDAVQERRQAIADIENKSRKNQHLRTASPVVRHGSILSEKGWTPMLNDALILANITKGRDFVLGLTEKERGDWDKKFLVEGNKNVHAKFPAYLATIQADGTSMWKEFLKDRTEMFFLNGSPRVFSREVLGMQFFGYEPVFSRQQLGFRAPKRSRLKPDFSTYLKKLRQVGFDGNNRQKIMREISIYLFGTRDALA